MLQKNIEFLATELQRNHHQRLIYLVTPDLNGLLTSALVKQLTLAYSAPLVVVPVAFGALPAEFKDFPFSPLIIAGGLLYSTWHQMLSKITGLEEKTIYGNHHLRLWMELQNLLLNAAAGLQEAYYLPQYQWTFTEAEKEQKCREWLTPSSSVVS
ncbi:hypothetical protein HY496_02770 [Candidatus Woesearchaeota archaeon]|nr:hypothetical protein [Candidatus Woesearchaeota archaeon]